MKWMPKFLLILVFIGNFIVNISSVAATDISTGVTTSLENENDFLNSLFKLFKRIASIFTRSTRIINTKKSNINELNAAAKSV